MSPYVQPLQHTDAAVAVAVAVVAVAVAAAAVAVAKAAVRQAVVAAG